MEDPAVSNFRQYLRIDTVQPSPNYDDAEVFLKQQAEDIGLKYWIIQVSKQPKRNIVMMTWEGKDPSLPAILLSSHSDVVPFFPEFWKHGPLEAFKEENGDIYARGTQDMKCVTIMYLEAIRRLKQAGKHFTRTIHLSVTTDEEIGSKLGMKILVNMEEFKSLNIGFALDEGLANPNNVCTVFYGERSPWWVKVRATGQAGHGSRMIEDNAGEKIRKVINSFLEYRDKEEKRMKADGLLLGDITTVNLTKLEGGVQTNIVPKEFIAYFDVRITPTVNLGEFEAMIQDWCSKAGKGVTYEFEQKFEGNNLSPHTDADPWWRTFTAACREAGLNVEPEIFPAATDSRFLRSAGYTAIGFSPLPNTPILLHDHNEFLNEKVFLKGIDAYVKIIPALASLPPL